MNQHERERIEILERRAEYLEKKVKDFPEDKNVDYKRHEASAIRWALEVITNQEIEI
jgi:hypothetical protein